MVSPTDLCAKQMLSNGDLVDGGLEFLDDSWDDPTDIFDGTLEIDMDMADAKDIDDSATVAGAMDELRKRESQLEDAFYLPRNRSKGPTIISNKRQFGTGTFRQCHSAS